MTSDSDGRMGGPVLKEESVQIMKRALGFKEKGSRASVRPILFSTGYTGK
jgi:hypothetical protein